MIIYTYFQDFFARSFIYIYKHGIVNQVQVEERQLTLKSEAQTSGSEFGNREQGYNRKSLFNFHLNFFLLK